MSSPSNNVRVCYQQASCPSHNSGSWVQTGALRANTQQSRIPTVASDHSRSDCVNVSIGIRRGMPRCEASVVIRVCLRRWLTSVGRATHVKAYGSFRYQLSRPLPAPRDSACGAREQCLDTDGRLAPRLERQGHQAHRGLHDADIGATVASKRAEVAYPLQVRRIRSEPWWKRAYVLAELGAEMWAEALT
jgi:hypothetical protein